MTFYGFYFVHRFFLRVLLTHLSDFHFRRLKIYHREAKRSIQFIPQQCYTLWLSLNLLKWNQSKPRLYLPKIQIFGCFFPSQIETFRLHQSLSNFSCPFQLQPEVSNFGRNFPISIFRISLRTIQLKTFELLVLSNYTYPSTNPKLAIPISLLALFIVAACFFDFIDLTTGEKSITVDVSGI